MKNKLKKRVDNYISEHQTKLDESKISNVSKFVEFVVNQYLKKEKKKEKKLI